MQIVLLLSKALGNIILTLSKAKRRLLPKNAQSDKVKRRHSVLNYPKSLNLEHSVLNFRLKNPH